MERFAYYGMLALLVLYLTEYLFKPGRVETVLGYGAIKTGLELLFGPLDVQPLASQIYGFFTGLVYLTPILGGLLADRVLGQRYTIILGAIVMAIGHFMMVFESLCLLALVILIVGAGGFKPNITTQVGSLYTADDKRRDRAYSIFYLGVNLGAFLAPLVCGTLGEHVGWRYGFLAAGIGVTIALGIYIYGLRALPPDEWSPAAPNQKRPLRREEWHAVVALIVIGLIQALFWAAYEQQGNTILLWVNNFTSRSVDLFFFWKGEIRTTWFLALNPVMILVFTPLIVMLWTRQAKRGAEPQTLTKMVLGCFIVAAAYLIMAASALTVAPGDKASWLWLLGYFAVITIGEVYISPIGLALVARVAPHPIRAMMMGIWLATSFLGNVLGGFIGSFWSSTNKVSFFVAVAAIAGVAGAAILTIARPLSSGLIVSPRDSIT